MNPLCSCSLSVKNNVHSYLKCQHFSLQNETLKNNISYFDNSIINETDTDLVNILIFGSSKCEYQINSKIPTFPIDFILHKKRFSDELFW